ncbi:hypothetical protein N1030_09310 [Desulfovibrio mangrovi]|uniref:hypothetical protein n=1 Tax=Desulfovibrio mangrovi TaxID=2976983 RepID=UPI002245CD82|nr:hypothetical protein [Desulfovibrio mangrovi]UZP65828.1 hypothetical protein N1030_09310 [Desulfovibrio mangrovi]
MHISGLSNTSSAPRNAFHGSLRAICRLSACMLLSVILLSGCGGYSGDTPIERVSKALADKANFSVVLADAKEENGQYFQKLYVVEEGKEQPEATDWLETSQEDFESMIPLMGMTVFSKKDGQESFEAAPPGYEYVGDSRYGEWQRDSSGGSFWMYYGQYRLMSDLLGWGRVRQGDYATYQNHRQNSQPYYGPNKEYGMNGEATRKKHPEFFQRAQSKEVMKKSSFANKVQSRIGRTSTSSMRARSGGVGK